MFSCKISLLKVSLTILAIAVAVNSLLKWIWSIHGIIQTPLSSYDYIVVGGGTAGSAIARRLWGRGSVLVVEAGTTPPWISAVPLMAPSLQGYATDWAYRTEPQMFSHRGMNERRSNWPRGKALGGSSVINYLLHTWGIRDDFDHHWTQLLDSQEWSYDAVRPYYKKVEKFLGDCGPPDPGQLRSGMFVDHGMHKEAVFEKVAALKDEPMEQKTDKSTNNDRGMFGLLPVERLREDISILAKAYIDGASSLGIPVGDLNGNLDDGAMYSQSNTVNGYRVSAFDAYLSPILNIANMHLLTSTLATKILFENFRAVGLMAENTYSGEKFEIAAKKEVILCAGVIGTAQLLLLSGVGPKSQLERLNIPLIYNLPGVGQSLRDHLNVPMYFHLTAPISITTSKARAIREIWTYLTTKRGYLARSGVEALTRLSRASANDSTSKMYFMLFNMGSVNEEVFTTIANFKRKIFHETFPQANNNSKEGFILLSTCTHPVSKGTLTLASSNPFDPPIIDPRYLEEPEDVKCLAEAMKTASTLGLTKPLQKLGSSLFWPIYRDCSHFNQSFDDLRYVECWMRTSAITAYHPVGTCPMGKSGDPMAVLDTKLRVRGLRNLRIADASAFPHLVSGNPQATVLMLAERAADFILGEP